MKTFTLIPIIAAAFICLSTSSKGQNTNSYLILRDNLTDSVNFRSPVKSFDLNIREPEVNNSGTQFVKRPGYLKTGGGPVALPNSYVKANDSSTPIPTYRILMSNDVKSVPKQ